MRKKIILYSTITICLLIIIGTFFYYSYFTTNNSDIHAESGVYTLDSDQSPYLLDCYLNGEWEYYPDELLFSSDNEENLPGQLYSIDPSIINNRIYSGEEVNIPYFPSLSTTVSSETALYTNIPGSFFNISSVSNVTSKASYRLIIKNMPIISNEDMVLSFPGLMYGNYKVFINGMECSCLTSPYGYPVYFFSATTDEIEIVIETTNTSNILNICPRLSFKGNAMTEFDSYKNMFIIIASILSAAFVILMILVFSLEPKYYRLLFLNGLIFTIFFAINNLWITGYLDSITKYFPQYFLHHIAWIILIIGNILSMIIFKLFFDDYYSKKILEFFKLSLFACILFRLIYLLVPNLTILQFLSNLIPILIFIYWLILTFKTLNKISGNLFVFQIGYIIILTGSITSIIYNYFGYMSRVMSFAPLCIVTYIVLIFFSSKYYQSKLLNHTIELLELEKETTRIQTAMLSSQIQPHFLYNTLTAIQEMCYTDPELAGELIVHCSQYLRNNIDFMDYNDLIPFSQELNHIDNYMYIQNARFGNSLTFTKNINYSDFYVPPLTIQPFIENAVNYGIRQNSNHGTISLEIYKKNAIIYIIIKNSGPGFNTENLNPNHSINNIKKRLKFLVNGQVFIHSKENIPDTTVEIQIPVSSQKNNIERKNNTL